MAVLKEVSISEVTSGKLQMLRTVHLGIAFMILFSADNMRTNVMKLLNESIHHDKPSYSVDGYVVLGLIYVVYGLSLFAAPSLITVTGPRGAMFIGASLMTGFLFLLTLEITWVTYFGIVLTGLGGSLVWVGQGNYVVLNSEPDKHSIHVSVFWALFTLSTILGNLIAALLFVGKERMDSITRKYLVYSMLVLGGIATAMFASLRPGRRKAELEPSKETWVEALKKMLAITLSRELSTLLITFCFMGFQQSFGWGVYTACIGFTRSFGTYSTQLAPITAAIYGAGGTIGGGINAYASCKGYKWNRSYIFGAGLLLQSLAFVGILLNLPNSSVFGYTDETPYLDNSLAWLACLCSFLIGVGDSFYNTQLYPLLATLHPTLSAHTTALYKLTKSMAMAAFFFASTAVGLHTQLILMILVGIIALLCFCIVDKRVRQKQNINAVE